MMTRKETAIAIAMAMVVATAAVHQEATAKVIIKPYGRGNSSGSNLCMMARK